MTGFDAGPPALPQWSRDLFDVDQTPLVARVVEADIAAAFGDLRDNREFTDQLTASVTENLCALREVASGRITLAEVDLAEPRRLASLQARLGVPQASLQLSYRVGFLEIWRGWAARIEASGQPVEARAAALRALTELIFAYQNAALAQVANQHVRVEASLRRSRDHLRRVLIRDLLTGSVEADAADHVVLGYDLGCSHVAVSVPDQQGSQQGTEPDWIRRVRACCHVSATLSYQTGEGNTVWWFGQLGWSRAGLCRLDEILRESGLAAEVSAAGAGVRGFRTTFEQVNAVRVIRARWTRTAEIDGGCAAAKEAAVLSHADVSIEALMLSDIAAVQSFVVSELGQLASTGRHAAMLRETLRIWLEARSHVTAAAALGLHEHTVRNRIRRVEEMLGHSVSGRHAELALALRIRRIIGAELAADAPAADLSAHRAVPLARLRAL